MNKHYVSAQQLLQDSFSLAMAIFDSGFKPDFIVGVWRGGASVGIAVQELLELLGTHSDHIAIRTSSYTGIGQRAKTVEVHGLSYIIHRASSGQSVLLVDDVYDTGLSLQSVIEKLEAACAHHQLDIRVATPYFKPGNNQTNRTPDYYMHESAQWLVFPHELSGLTTDEIRQNKPELKQYLDKIELSQISAD
jgi:hypoxanthine phosphoribosyltransferase